jgi:hypothetical protein
VAVQFRLYYRHESGAIHSQDIGLPALGPAVVGTPSWVPTAGHGIEVISLTGHWVVAERMF